jgi:predicted lipoprotein with Yx(FWY)xxD motif
MNMNRSSIATAGLILLAAMIGLAACAPSPTPAAPAQAPTVAAASSAPSSSASLPASTGSTGASAQGGALVKLARVTGFGLFLTDSANRTLYAFDKDTKDTSNCSGTCAQNWPAFTTQGQPQADTGINATLLGTAKRSDGTTQVTYDGHPLYYFAGDKNPGDIKGQGVGNLWHVLSPRGNPMLNSAGPAATATP